MSGEKNLSILLKNMDPELHEDLYVFSFLPPGTFVDNTQYLFTFIEKEGITVVLKKSDADLLNLHYTFVAKWITLKVHSSLSAVGLTAAFSSALANHNISCNVVAAYHHDHIFVDEKDADTAMEVLINLTKNNY